MESLSRPFHRRKLSNANSFSGKNAYDGVFSGHRPKYDGAPAVNVEEYREIFSSSQTDSSIPVLDLSTLEDSSLNLEVGSKKPDYGMIFGGFRDQDIAVSYEELVARDKARAHSSTSQSSQDLGDLTNQPLDDLKQFNMSYNKISKRSKDGLDGTTHVTQLHAVPGFTCFIDESASQPKKKTDNQKSVVTNNNIHPSVNSNKPEKETSRNDVKSKSKDLEDESISDRNLRTFQANLKSQPSKISSSPEASESKNEIEKQKSSATNNVPSKISVVSQPKKEIENQKSSATNNNILPDVHSNKPEKQTSLNDVKSKSKDLQNESLSDGRNLKTFQPDLKSQPSKLSSSSPPASFDEEVDVNSPAAALRKAIEKAQESIRIAKESVGRKKEGLKGGFSSKSFKDSLKVKNLSAGEQHKIFGDDVEKLFVAKKVINEIHEKIAVSDKNSEIPIRSPLELRDDKITCDYKQVIGETEATSVEYNNTCEQGPLRPNGFLVLESCEKKPGDTESNNLSVCQKVETEKKMSEKSDENDYEKKPSEESLGLLENKKQENLELEHDEKVECAESEQVEDEREVKEDNDKFYDVCEVEMIKNAQTYDYSIETNDLSQKEDYEIKKENENHKLDKFQDPEIYENSSSDYDDAEESESVICESHIVDDTEVIDDVSKVDQTDNHTESSQEIYDVSSSCSAHEFQVEETEAIEKEIFQNISSDQTTSENEDECEAKSDDLSADVDFVQNDVRSDSSSDTIQGMEIEVKEYKEENNHQQSHEEKPEIRIKFETGTPQEPEDARRESEPIKVVEKVDNKEERERERIKLAVERAIREARERAFAEVRQRVIADTQGKVTKASSDNRTSAQSKLRAERAAVERATAEARQRALEKAISQKKISEPKIQVNEIKQTSSTSHTSAESALRSKAKLEKHNRIMERAAKALAEKEKRDLLALKEQAERSRLAENLDADIKRWSSGKEGNLRALLSTLQYILGADSGWQPVSLTEIITTSAVKKAYRKATLCVHPDKLQQRGASIQQKYICEKVFDLLKAAWNRFNSEER